jgi:hypothetical protein
VRLSFRRCGGLSSLGSSRRHFSSITADTAFVGLEDAGAMSSMKSVRARAATGSLVLDEPLELRDGTEVEVIVPDHDLSAEELEELEQAIDDSKAELARGELIDAGDVLAFFP